MKRILIFLIPLFFLLFSCQKEDYNVQKQNDKETTIFDRLFPGIEGETITLSNGISLLKFDSIYVLGDDVLLSKRQVDQLSNLGNQFNLHGTKAAVSTEYLKYWPVGLVYYEFHDALPSTLKNNIRQAISHWEQNTGLRFLVKGKNNPNYILFHSMHDFVNYSTSIGMAGDCQEINMAYGSSIGSAIHEIGHAIGLFHEQSRSDRDQNINVLWSNIVSSARSQYYTYIESNEGGMDVGNFDFNSIMLYSPINGFSINGLPTMTKTDGTIWQANRDYLSAGDILGVEFLYGPGYGKVERKVVYDYHDNWGFTDVDELIFENTLYFYSDKNCTQKAPLSKPRRIVIRHETEDIMSIGEPNTYYRFIDVPAGTTSISLGETTYRALYVNGYLQEYSETRYKTGDHHHY